MAFNEGLKQKIDLLAALQARRGFDDDVESRKQKELQNRLMQEQLDAAEWQNLKDRTRPTMTVPSSGLTGMPHKIFLDEAAGYISGVSPTDTFNQWNQNFRQGMASGGGGGGYGGGRQGSGGGGATETKEPGGKVDVQSGGYGYYGPDRNVQLDSVSAAKDLAALYGVPNAGPGGGAVSNGDTYKSFSESPVENTGRIVDARGNETITGTAPAADYQSGLAGKAEVDQILKDRAELPAKQAAARAKVMNDATRSVSSDPRFGELSDKKKSYILNNMEKIVTDSIRENGTPIFDVGWAISKYGKTDDEKQ